MNTISNQNIDSAMEDCRRVLAVPGAVILIPTETVYGLVCRWDDAAARERIYQLKKRDARKPLPMFAAGETALLNAGVLLDRKAEILLRKFTPGPITIIAANRDGTTTGFRIPDHPLVKKLLDSLDFPLASTSANLSGAPNALSITEALSELCGEPDLVIDGGSIPPDSRASTVVDVSGDTCRILRPGPISAEEITAALEE